MANALYDIEKPPFFTLFRVTAFGGFICLKFKKISGSEQAAFMEEFLSKKPRIQARLFTSMQKQAHRSVDNFWILVIRATYDLFY
jgi:hypothetical protein